MYKALTPTQCCPEFDPLPSPVHCFQPDVCQELKRLVCRYNALTTKKSRLLRLAVPKRITPRYVPQCPCHYKKSIQIIRLEDHVNTRTQQLAYPQARKLLLFRQAVLKMFPAGRIEVINRMIRTSLFSLYSRLENVQPPKKPVPVHRWDKKEWKMHTKYLKKLAKHKMPPLLPRWPRRCMPLKKMRRYKKLAKPKRRDEFEKINWVLTPELKFYKASPRIFDLAKSVIRDEEALHQTLPLQVPPNALRYKASARIKELATATERRAGELDIRENPFGIQPNALKAKPSKRTKELAEPKEFENTHIRENPFLISPAALTAKPSARTCELAKPKGS